MSSETPTRSLSELQNSRASKCRKCGQRFRAPKVLYGFPSFTMLLLAARHDDIVLGGCIPGLPVQLRCGCPTTR